ncbi:MAG: hypothetical protein ACRCX2_18155, partial [Paraclostridium sp.]
FTSISSGKYEINGVDLAKAVWFYRTPQEQYLVLPKGSYTITTEGANTYLLIHDQGIISTAERIQLCYEFASMSSEYQVDFGVDVNVLKDRYNELVDDVKSLFKYVQTNMMAADGLDVELILPQLDNGEVWMRTETGYRGFNVGEIDKNIQDFWVEFNAKTQEVLENISNQGDKQVERINDTASEVDNRLQMIWRMYSILTGSQRYLSGNVLTLRDPSKLEKSIDGGSLANRVGEPKRIYVGGELSNRIIKVPLQIDLGEYK